MPYLFSTSSTRHIFCMSRQNHSEKAYEVCLRDSVTTTVYTTGNRIIASKFYPYPAMDKSILVTQLLLVVSYCFLLTQQSIGKQIKCILIQGFIPINRVTQKLLIHSNLLNYQPGQAFTVLQSINEPSSDKAFLTLCMTAPSAPSEAASFLG